MYDAIIVVILMILRGILNIASATCSHYLGFRLETNLRKNGLHKLLDASSSFFDHNSSGEIRKIIDDNAAETHKTVAHLIPDNVTAVMTPVLMFVLMFAIDYRLGILLILTTVIGVLQYRKMSGGTEFLSGYSAALQKMSAATVEYVRGMQIIKIFGVTVQYYKTLINSIKEYKQYVYQYSLSCKNPYVGFQVLFNVFYAFAVPAAVVFISYGEPAMLAAQLTALQQCAAVVEVAVLVPLIEIGGQGHIQLEAGQLGRQHGEAVLAGGERQCAAIIPLHENLTLIVHKVYFALRAGKNGMIRVLHRIKPDAGAGGILLLDEIHHFSLHTHIPPIVMPCLGVF